MVRNPATAATASSAVGVLHIITRFSTRILAPRFPAFHAIQRREATPHEGAASPNEEELLFLTMRNCNAAPTSSIRVAPPKLKNDGPERSNFLSILIVHR